MSVVVDLDKAAADLAQSVSAQLLDAARRGGSEADFRREAARILDEAAAAAGLTITPRDEYCVACGRVDSVYNRFVLEYKRPGVLAKSPTHRPTLAVVEQVKNYILDVARRERREAQRLAGVATDGYYLVFVRRVGDGWSDPETYPVSKGSVERLLRLLFSLAVGAALVPENLVEDFGPRTWRAQKAVRALYRALYGTKHPLVTKLFEQWRVFFSEATDYKEWADRIESKEEFRSFVKGMGLDPKYAEAPRVFFALHTYYALLIKLVASLAAARFAGASSLPLSELAALDGPALREALANLERGGLFREYGIRNFLEGDFFGWYLAGWDDSVDDAVRSLIQRLAVYDPGTLELAPENARDLLKKLYHYLLPREIRHDLGEYYTPDWLADRLIIQTLGQAGLGDATKRVLDPACGSGTFLVILIKYIRERAAESGARPADTLKLILQNVVGIDLNPLAVIAARTNYLLALGDLLKARPGDIDIPVYQADSVLTPAQGTGLFEGDVYPLKTSAGVFRVPAIFATRDRMDSLANVLDESVEVGVAEGVFLKQLTETARLSDQELKTTECELRALYRNLKELHDSGLNGVWARIIKNAFAPMFLELSDFVVGNPPWVNWESLPDDYRLQTKPLWEHYGLFPHSGMDTILGKGKKDISMLMAYVAVDRYLRRGGKLGFVLSQSLFKTSGAGQGFRRFLLPDKTPFGPTIVEDMLDLKPFEGATNRTVVAVFAKGRAVRYPVPYSYWKRRQRGRAGTIGFDTPYKQVTTEKITYRQWYAEPVRATDKTSAWITAKLRALQALRKLSGSSSYRGHEGVNTGGANGLFWMEVVGERPSGLVIASNVLENLKRKVPSAQTALEQDLLYPLVRGRDVARWKATPKISILLTQDPHRRRGIARDELERKYPKTLAYLKRNEELLRSRSAFRRYFSGSDEFWSMFNVGTYTLARYQVAWGRVANEVDAAVLPQGAVGRVRKIAIPAETCVSIECGSAAEAHYVAAVLNSAPVRLAVRQYIVLHPDGHILENFRIPTFKRTDRVHEKLSELSQSAHKAAGAGREQEVRQFEDQVDRLASKLWGLADDELLEIRSSLQEI